MIKVGKVIADEMEFKPFYENLRKFDNCKEVTIGGDRALEAVVNISGCDVCLKVILSGVGKVCAAAAAAFLIADGCDLIINSGLSGALSGVKKGDIVIGTSYQMTDFDLTAIGYKKGDLCGMNSIFYADEKLVEAFIEAVPSAKMGKLACGDIFVADSELKAELKDTFDSIACDMESAAIALVCYKSGIPFLSFRRISDDADDSAAESYTEMNNMAEATLYEITLAGLSGYFAYK